MACYQFLQTLPIICLALVYNYSPKLKFMWWVIFIPFVGTPFLWLSFAASRKNRNKYLSNPDYNCYNNGDSC